MKPYALVVAAVVMLSAIACQGKSDATTSDPGASSTKPVTLHLAYFPNVTHAQPIVALARGTFADKLGANVKLETKTFNAGPAEIEALFSGDIDIGYIGPNPTVNGYVKSRGEDVRVIAGAVSGGAQLIVRDGAAINESADFANKKIASPQLGGTQDVALRAWLTSNGLKARQQGGNVTVLPSANADTLTLMRKGDIDAAWVPEPWSTRLVQEAGGKVFLDEKALWPNGEWITTNVIVRTAFLDKHPDVVENFLRAHVETTQWIAAHPEEAKALVNQGIADLTGGKALSASVIDEAWTHIRVTNDPLASTLIKSAADAFALGFLDKKPDLTKLYALGPLNNVLREYNLPEVKGG